VLDKSNADVLKKWERELPENIPGTPKVTTPKKITKKAEALLADE
jgi:hypothetical protein